MSEYQEHAAIVQYFRAQYPKYARSIRVSHGGKYWGGSGKERAIRQRQAMAQGGVVGEADLAILVPRGGHGCLLMEIKTGKGKATKPQAEYIDYHNGIGNCAVVVHGVDVAIAAIDAYMAGEGPPTGKPLQAITHHAPIIASARAAV